MILSDLKTFLHSQRAANLMEMTQRFQTEPAVIRDMLQVWIRKGCIEKAAAVPGCGSSCSKCNPLLTEVYCWVD